MWQSSYELYSQKYMYGYIDRYIWLYSSQLWLWLLASLILVKMRCDSRANFIHPLGYVTSKLKQYSQKKGALWLQLYSQYLRNGPYSFFKDNQRNRAIYPGPWLWLYSQDFLVIWLCGYIAKKSWQFSQKFLAT